MRFAHVRVAAVTLLSGSFLTLGVLGSAEAAPLATTGNTDTCVPGPACLGYPDAFAVTIAVALAIAVARRRPLAVALDEFGQCVPESLHRGQYAAEPVPAAGQ